MLFMQVGVVAVNSQIMFKQRRLIVQVGGRQINTIIIASECKQRKSNRSVKLYRGGSSTKNGEIKICIGKNGEDNST